MNLQFESIASLQPYQAIFDTMRNYTLQRDNNSPDRILFLEHAPVFTQGQAGKPEHLLTTTHSIPLIQSDRGGQITYHGPGQLMTYVLVDIKRRNLGVRTLVSALEQTFIDLLASYQLEAYARKDAPGVYLKDNDAKIASIGLRIREGKCYHGVSFNLAMDLAPFQWINPCGFKNLAIAQLSDFVPDLNRADVEAKLQSLLERYLAPATASREY